jgi:photosystem II stability/assembly factor-like uncharacterized protein
MRVLGRILSFLLMAAGVMANASGQWIKIGGEAAGPIITIAESESLVIVGIASGKIFISQDAGVTWGKRSTGLPGTEVNCLLGEDGRLFAGTGGSGIWCSTDGGLSWTNVSMDC